MLNYNFSALGRDDNSAANGNGHRSDPEDVRPSTHQSDNYGYRSIDQRANIEIIMGGNYSHSLSIRQSKE